MVVKENQEQSYLLKKVMQDGVDARNKLVYEIFQDAFDEVLVKRFLCGVLFNCSQKSDGKLLKVSGENVDEIEV